MATNARPDQIQRYSNVSAVLVGRRFPPPIMFGRDDEVATFRASHSMGARNTKQTQKR